MDKSAIPAADNEEVVASTSQGREPVGKSPYTMTEEILRKRLKQKNRGRFVTQLCVAITASLAALVFGAVLGWSSPATHYLLHVAGKCNVSEEVYRWVASMLPLGYSVGIMPCSYTINTIGPKHTMIVLTPICSLTYLSVIIFRKFDTFLASRFVCGFVSISYIMSAECLLMDSVHRGHLPNMIVVFRSSKWLGVLLSYLIVHFLTERWLTLFCAGIPILNTALLLLMPESPIFLYNKSENKALKALSWYRGHLNIHSELRFIKKDLEVRKVSTESLRYMLYSKVVMKAFLIVFGLTFFQVFSGYYAFIFYNLLLWRDLKAVFNPLKDAVIFGCVLCVSNIVGSIMHFRIPFGVRKPLLLSCGLVATVLTVFTAYLFLYDENIIDVRPLKWIPLVALNLFVVSYEAGLATYPDIIFFETLPYQVHERARAILRVCYWLMIFLLMKYFITVRSFINIYVTFGILTLLSYISIIYCYITVIETKGKNLMQIQLEIGGNPIGSRSAYRNHFGNIKMQRMYDR